MPFLRQSTSQVIRFGPCLDITDGVTEETALTLAQADMRLSKDGGAFAQKSAAGNATHDSDGWYSTTLSTTDTDTVGEIRLNVHQPANMLPVWDRWWVIEEAVYDAIYGASAALAMGSVTGAVGSVTGAAGSVTGSVGSVVGHTAQTGDSFARIGVAGAGLTNIDLPNQTMDITGDITGNVSGSVGSVTGAVGSVTGAVGSVAGNVDGNVTGSVGSLVGHTVQTGDSFGRIGLAGAGLTNIDLPNQTMDVTGNITGNLSGSVGSVTGAVGSVAGNVDGSVGSVVGAVGSVTGAVGSVTGAVGSVAGNVDGSTASVTGAVGSVTGAVGSVTGNVGGNVVGSVASVTAEVTADMTKISGSAQAADNLEASALSMVKGTVNTGVVASTTTTFQSADVTEATADHFIGRVALFWDDGFALFAQACRIVDYELNGAEGKFTVTALTEAPADGAPFVIV